MIEQFIKDVEDLLEWMPVCSVGSTGHTRRLRVEAGLQRMKDDLQAVRTKYANSESSPRTKFVDMLDRMFTMDG